MFTPILGVSWSNLTCAYFETDGLVKNHQLALRSRTPGWSSVGLQAIHSSPNRSPSDRQVDVTDDYYSEQQEVVVKVDSLFFFLKTREWLVLREERMLIWYCDFHSNTGSPVGYPVEISVKRSQGSYPWDVVINVVMGDLAKQNSAPEEWRFAISTFQSGLCSGATWCQEGCSKIFHLFSPWRIPKAYFWWEKHVMSRQVTVLGSDWW